MKKKRKLLLKTVVVILVILLALILWLMNYHVNLSGTPWRCEAWMFIDRTPQGLLNHCYSKFNNWELPEIKDWKIYDDQSYRLVFKYPPSWTLLEAKGTSDGKPTSKVVGIKRGAGDEVRVTFYVAGTDYESQLNRSQEYWTVIDKKELVVDGKRVIRKITTFKGPVPPYPDKEKKYVDYIVELRNNYLLGIELYEKEDGDYKLTDQDIQEFDLMMQTLNFPD